MNTLRVTGMVCLALGWTMAWAEEAGVRQTVEAFYAAKAAEDTAAFQRLVAAEAVLSDWQRCITSAEQSAHPGLDRLEYLFSGLVQLINDPSFLPSAYPALARNP